MTDRWPRAMPAETAAEYCGIGITMLRRTGPAPVRIGEKRLVWMKEDLDKWLDRLAGRETVSADDEPWPVDNGSSDAALSSGL